MRASLAHARTRADSLARSYDALMLARAGALLALDESTSASVASLDRLEVFLRDLQRDLELVQGGIGALQGRSKELEGRLEARKVKSPLPAARARARLMESAQSVESELGPMLESITLPPPLLDVLYDSPCTDAWLAPIQTLDRALSCVRSGPRVAARQDLDLALEGCRQVAAHKITQHLAAQLRPFTDSTELSAASLHATLANKKPLFDFLRRHAPRHAHELERAYAATLRWFFETAFRRYVRALEKARLRSTASADFDEEDGVGPAVGDSSAHAMSKHATDRTLNVLGAGRSASRADLASIFLPSPALVALSRATAESSSGGAEDAPVVTAHQVNSANRRQRWTRLALARSIMLVLFDNAASTYAFIDAFFVQHSAVPGLASSSGARSAAARPTLFSNASDFSFDAGNSTFGGGGGGAGASVRNGRTATLPGDESLLYLDETMSSITGTQAGGARHAGEGDTMAAAAANGVEGANGGTRKGAVSDAQARKEQRRREASVEKLWRLVMDPAIEYSWVRTPLTRYSARPLPQKLIGLVTYAHRTCAMRLWTLHRVHRRHLRCSRCARPCTSAQRPSARPSPRPSLRPCARTPCGAASRPSSHTRETCSRRSSTRSRRLTPSSGSSRRAMSGCSTRSSRFASSLPLLPTTTMASVMKERAKRVGRPQL